MKKIIIFLTCFFALNIAKSQGINFQTGQSWQQILQKAKTENKHILLDVYATWCTPCKVMDREVFPEKQAGDFFNAHFISVKVQNDVTKNDPEEIKAWYAEAQRITKAYDVSMLPSFVFLNPDGEVVYKAIGYRTLDDFIKEGKKALDPANQYGLLISAYEKGKREPGFVRSLARKTLELGKKEKAQQIAGDYINGLDKKELLSKENALFLLDFTNNSKDPGFAVIHSRRKEVNNLVDDKEYAKRIIDFVIYNEEIKPYETSLDGKPDWERLRANAKKYGAAGEDMLASQRPHLLYSYQIKPFLLTDPAWPRLQALISSFDLGKGEQQVLIFIKAFYLNGITSANAGKNLTGVATQLEQKFSVAMTPAEFNTLAMKILQLSTDKRELSTALNWSKQVIDKNPDPGFIDTYARLLYKMGKKKEAIVWQEKALAGVPGNVPLKAVLDKMKKGQVVEDNGIPFNKAVTNPNFSGNWTFNKEKSDFGNLDPNTAAAVNMHIIQNEDSITLERTFTGIPVNIETLPLDGKTVHLNANSATSVSRNLIWSEDRKMLTVYSKYKVQGEDSYDFSRVEAYRLTDAGKTLIIQKVTSLPNALEKVKLVYEKSKIKKLIKE